jgi:hypothetical protein
MMSEQHRQIRDDFHNRGIMRYRPKPIATLPAEQSRYAFVRRHLARFHLNPVPAERD